MANGITVAPKAPADVVDYTVTFKGLGTDTIESISVTGSGITIAGSPAPSFVNTPAVVVTFWASGGSANTTGEVTVEIVTDGGRTIERIISIPIESL